MLFQQKNKFCKNKTLSQRKKVLVTKSENGIEAELKNLEKFHSLL